MMKPCIIRSIKRPAAGLSEALGGFGVATVHEAYAQQGLLRPDLRPVIPGLRICGPAVTALCHAGDNIMLHAAIDVAQRGDVIVIATKSPCTDGMLGELIATQCLARGLAGAVLDAGSRDSARLRELGFPVWSRAISASGTSKATPGWVNVPVSIGGVTISPGDLVVADDDGVVVVAAADVQSVIKASEARVAKENASRKRYQQGESSLDVSSLRAVLEQLGVRTYETADQAAMPSDR